MTPALSCFTLTWLRCKAGHVVGCNSLGISKESPGDRAAAPVKTQQDVIVAVEDADIAPAALRDLAGAGVECCFGTKPDPGREIPIQSILRQSRSAKASLAQWACHGCPWLVENALTRRL